MTTDERISDWYQAVCRSAEIAEKGMAGIVPAESVQMKKLRILFREYLAYNLEIKVSCADLYEPVKGSDIEKTVRLRLTEDRTADTAPEEKAEIDEFMEAVREAGNVCMDRIFPLMVRKAVSGGLSDVSEESAIETADRSAKAAYQDLRSFMKDRKARYIAENGAPDDDGDDEPPQGLDEFEYIDWVLSH